MLPYLDTLNLSPMEVSSNIADYPLHPIAQLILEGVVPPGLAGLNLSLSIMNRVLAFYTIVILNTSLISGIGSMIIKRPSVVFSMRSGNSIRLKSELLDFIVTDALSISFKIWNGSLLFGTRSPAKSTSFLIYKPCQKHKIIQLSCIVLPLNHHTTQGTCIQLP
jgi:hypothetical protein